MPSLSPSLWMMEHTVLGQKVVIFTDDGSNAFMITHNLAGKLMLFGTPMEQMIEVLGQEPEHRSTNLYKLDLVDRFGDVHCMQLIGIDKISTNPNPVNSAYNIFPHLERWAIGTPSGYPHWAQISRGVHQEEGAVHAVQLLRPQGTDLCFYHHHQYYEDGVMPIWITQVCQWRWRTADLAGMTGFLLAWRQSEWRSPCNWSWQSLFSFQEEPNLPMLEEGQRSSSSWTEACRPFWRPYTSDGGSPETHLPGLPAFWPISQVGSSQGHLCSPLWVVRSHDDGQTDPQWVTVLQALPESAARVTMIGDSEAALKSMTTSLAQNFGNRVAEILGCYQRHRVTDEVGGDQKPDHYRQVLPNLWTSEHGHQGRGHIGRVVRRKSLVIGTQVLQDTQRTLANLKRVQEPTAQEWEKN